MTLLAYILIGVLVLWHVYGAALASWHISASELFDPWQKKAQHILAWCLPIFGVAIILHMLGPVVRKRRPGWVPLLEPIILSSFLMSVEHSSEPSDVSADAVTNPEGATDGGD